MNNDKSVILKKIITVVVFFSIAMVIVFIMNSLDHDESTLEEGTTAAVEVEEQTFSDTAVSEDNSGTEEVEAVEVSESDNEDADDTSETDEETGDTSEINEETVDTSKTDEENEIVTYVFRKKSLLDQHYQKHGIEMGFDSAEAYEKAASAVVTNPKSLHKTEEEDGDDCYYLEDTNEFVVVSTDGYIRTYFKPDRGKAYFDKQ